MQVSRHTSVSSVDGSAGPVTVLSFVETRMLDDQAAYEVAQDFAQLRGRPRLLIDFSNVASLGSALLGKLISFNAKIQQEGGQMRMCSMPTSVKDIVKLMSLDKLFDIHETAAEALASFR